MAFDGIVVASLASELKHKLLNGRISWVITQWLVLLLLLQYLLRKLQRLVSSKNKVSNSKVLRVSGKIRRSVYITMKFLLR